MLLTLMFNYSLTIPLSFDFTCKEAQTEKKFEHFITVGNSSDINTITIHRSLQYFNASLSYKDTIINKINT